MMKYSWEVPIEHKSEKAFFVGEEGLLLGGTQSGFAAIWYWVSYLVLLAL